MAIPISVTTTSTLVPGVITVLTDSTNVGMRPRTNGLITIDIFEAKAVSQWPPEAPRITPSEPVITFTLKSVSTSKAERIATSKRLITEPLDNGFAYMLASIS